MPIVTPDTPDIDLGRSRIRPMDTYAKPAQIDLGSDGAELGKALASLGGEFASLGQTMQSKQDQADGRNIDLLAEQQLRGQQAQGIQQDIASGIPNLVQQGLFPAQHSPTIMARVNERVGELRAENDIGTNDTLAKLLANKELQTMNPDEYERQLQGLKDKAMDMARTNPSFGQGYLKRIDQAVESARHIGLSTRTQRYEQLQKEGFVQDALAAGTKPYSTPNQAPTQTNTSVGTVYYDGNAATVNGKTFSGPANPVDVAAKFNGMGEKSHKEVVAEFIRKSGGHDIDPAQIPWCAAFVDAALGASGRQMGNTMRAGDFLEYGAETKKPSKGDVVVFGTRGEAQHVGLVIGIEGDKVRYIAGNDSHRVQENTAGLSSVMSFRHPPEAPAGGEPRAAVMGTMPKRQAITVSPAERDRMIRTVYGEAAGESDIGRSAVAHVVANRISSGSYGAGATGVLDQSQFKMWTPGDKVGDMATRLDPNGGVYKRIGKMVDDALAGKSADPTNGAERYYNPKSENPDWAAKLAGDNDVTVGNHRFVGKGGSAGTERVVLQPGTTVAPNTQAAPAGPGAYPMGSYSGNNATVLRSAAKELGTSPENLAMVISYESGFRTNIWGGKNGGYLGLIQFGGPEREKYHVTANQSFAEQMKSVVAYLKDRGYKPGMGLEDLYSTINAGRPGRYGASDGNGTVLSHVAAMRTKHAERAAKFLNEDVTSPGFASSGDYRTDMARQNVRDIDQVYARSSGLTNTVRRDAVVEAFTKMAVEKGDSSLLNRIPGEWVTPQIAAQLDHVRRQADQVQYQQFEHQRHMANEVRHAQEDAAIERIQQKLIANQPIDFATDAVGPDGRVLNRAFEYVQHHRDSSINLPDNVSQANANNLEDELTSAAINRDYSKIIPGAQPGMTLSNREIRSAILSRKDISVKDQVELVKGIDRIQKAAVLTQSPEAKSVYTNRVETFAKVLQENQLTGGQMAKFRMVNYLGNAAKFYDEEVRRKVMAYTKDNGRTPSAQDALTIYEQAGDRASNHLKMLAEAVKSGDKERIESAEITHQTSAQTRQTIESTPQVLAPDANGVRKIVMPKAAVSAEQKPTTQTKKTPERKLVHDGVNVILDRLEKFGREGDVFSSR